MRDVVPEVLEPVERARLRREDVQHHVDVVAYDPGRFAAALYIQIKVYGDNSLVRPARIRREFAIADEVPLLPGEYLLTLGCMTGERQLDLLEHVASFTVEPRDFFDSGYLPDHLNGPVLVRAAWDLRGANVDEPLSSVR